MKGSNDMGIGTKCVQDGYRPGNGEPRQVPIIQSTTFKYSSSSDMGKLFDLEAEGYFYTRNVKKYIVRIGIFAVISQIPFVVAEKLTAPPLMMIDGKLWINPELLVPSFNVMFTLLLGLVALLLWNIKIIEKPLRIMIVISLCFISLSGDWMYFTVLWILFFGIYRNDTKGKWISYYCIALSSMTIVITTNILGGLPLWHNFWQAGLLFPPFILMLHNGEKGSNTPFHKWFFYIFYPLHLLIIGIIKFYI